MSWIDPLTTELAHYFKKRVDYQDWTRGNNLIIPKHKKQPNWGRFI
tara:strand:+ start:2584 stop:2721 length:138 start_codon:yes stop_codon:yes gene_type:complete